MIPEKRVFRFCQNTTTYQTKIGRVFFLFSRIRTAAIPPSQMVPGNRTGVRAQLHALAKAVVTSSKNTPKDAVTRNFFVAADKARASSLAIDAGGTRQTNCIGTTPIHKLNPFPFPGMACAARPPLFLVFNLTFIRIQSIKSDKLFLLFLIFARIMLHKLPPNKDLPPI
jgi:hypothetical protein